MTVGELTYRGYYLGSNVSYNVKGTSKNSPFSGVVDLESG